MLKSVCRGESPRELDFWEKHRENARVANAEELEDGFQSQRARVNDTDEGQGFC